MEVQTSSSPHETNARKNAPIEYEDSAKAKGKRKAEWAKHELEDNNPNCVICLDPISEKCVAIPCRHSYDYVCILNWLELRQSCPLCNALVEGLLVHMKDGKIHRHYVEAPHSAFALVPSATSSSGPQQFALRNRTFSRRSRRHRSPPCVSEDTALLRRRYVYKHKLRSLYVGSNRISRFRNVTPRDFCNDEELVSRARMWIRRELRVWEWTSRNAEFLIEYVVGILKSVDLRGSAGQAEEMLSEILGKENAQIFTHELNAFVRSPFMALQPFDNFAQYKVPLPTSFDSSSLDVGEGLSASTAADSLIRPAQPPQLGVQEGSVSTRSRYRGSSSRGDPQDCNRGRYYSRRPGDV